MESLENDQSVASQQSSQGDSAPLVEYVLKKPKKSAPPRQSQWVCILPDTMAPISPDSATGDGPSFISLLDPRTGSAKRYLLSKNGTDICEVLEFSDEPRSWFIGNSVQREGNLYMCTPVDPLFLALPYLIGAAKSGKFTTLDAILEDTTYNSRVLEKCVHCEQWQHVCDMKVLQSGMKVYRYNRERTLEWLKTKVKSLSEQLEKQRVYVGSGSQSAVLIRSKQSDVTKEDYVCYACGILSDYLPKKVAEELANSYSFSKNKARKLEKNEETCASEPPAKKQCCEDGLVSRPGATEPLEDYTKFNPPSSAAGANKVTKLTAAQKSLAKVDKTGMKSLASFFTNKNKKKS